VIDGAIGVKPERTLHAEIRDHVLAGSALFTDALKSYEGLSESEHEVIDDAVQCARRSAYQGSGELLESVEARLARDLRRRRRLPPVPLP
jgi:hypothetical protein